MDVIVDGKSVSAPSGEYETAFEVLAGVDEVLRQEGRAILAVSIDGQPANPEELHDRLMNLGPDAETTVEITTEEIGKLVDSCLREMQEHLPELSKACHDLAQVFQGSRPEEGYEHFQQLAQIWHEVKHRQMLVCRALDLSLDDLQVKGLPFSKLHDDLNDFLNEAADAIEAGDCVTLGDLLEYELAPRAESEVDIVTLLQEHAQRSAK